MIQLGLGLNYTPVDVCSTMNNEHRQQRRSTARMEHVAPLVTSLGESRESGGAALDGRSFLEQQHGKNRRRRHVKNFQNSKNQVMGKRDKSSAGRIDPKAVEICGLINEKFDCFYTTSSCAGRCFLYRGRGVKSSHNLARVVVSTDSDNKETELGSSVTTPQQQYQPHFVRYRVSHDLIRDPDRYFDLSSLESDPSGGGDPIRPIGQYDHLLENEKTESQMATSSDRGEKADLSPIGMSKESEAWPSQTGTRDQTASMEDKKVNDEVDQSVWLRFEPFILHVACRSLKSASALMDAARPAFKNVGLTTWTCDNDQHDGSRFIVAIWGDEGLEMPLCMPNGTPLYGTRNRKQDPEVAEWLASLVNERHERNWSKIDRFVLSVRGMSTVVDEFDDDVNKWDPEIVDNESVSSSLPGEWRIPRSFDIVGDIAVLHAIATTNEEEQRAIGEAIMQRNKAIRVVVVRQSNMQGPERAPGEGGFQIIAGADRSPLITTHSEYGIKCVVDLTHTFFTPRMGQERLRLCQQVARGEHVLVLFCGVGMDAMQIAGRTEALSVTAIEQNEIAVQCALRSKRMLERNKGIKCGGAADRLEIIHGDVLEILPTLPRRHYDRIVAPRPKEGSHDGDLGTGDGGVAFLKALLPVMKPDGGECHWYDFAADHEFPTCLRTRQVLERVCEEFGLKAEIQHVANAGSVAMRQLRVCVSFRVKEKLQ